MTEYSLITMQMHACLRYSLLYEDSEDSTELPGDNLRKADRHVNQGLGQPKVCYLAHEGVKYDILKVHPDHSHGKWRMLFVQVRMLGTVIPTMVQ